MRQSAESRRRMTSKEKPTGLYYYDQGCLGTELCSKIYRWLVSREFRAKLFRVTPSNPKSRLVRHFGFKYDYSNGTTIKKTEAFPEILLELRREISRVWEQCDISEEHWNQCIINQYEPGQGIGAHIDKRTYGPYVVGFTFIGARHLIFSRRGFADYRVYTRPKSMYVMSGDSRNAWAHRMDKVKSDLIGGVRRKRQLCVSITFRHVPVAPLIES